MHDPRVIAADARAAQFLIPAADDAEDRAASLASARTLLMQAGAELMRAGLVAEATRVQSLHRDLPAE